MHAGKAMLDMWRISRRHPVTRDRQGAALMRYLRWQIAARAHGGPMIVPFVAPARLIVSKGDFGLTGNVYFGLAEMPEMAFVLHYLRPNDLFVDIGANLGSYSVLAAKVAGARVVAFEPIEAAAALMRDQLRLNDIADRVEIRPLALGPTIATVQFYDGLGPANRVIAEGETALGSYREAPQSTLDAEIVGASPVLLKLDVEGYEHAVLRGGVAVLAATSLEAVILEVHDGVATFGVGRADLQSLLSDAGFVPCAYDAASRRLTPTTFETAQAHRLSDNVLVVRNLQAVQARLASAPAFSVCGVTF